MASKTIIGDISTPPRYGITFLIGDRIGSVNLNKNWNRGLYGFGLNHEIKALPIISQTSNVKTMLIKRAMAIIKFSIIIYFLIILETLSDINFDFLSALLWAIFTVFSKLRLVKDFIPSSVVPPLDETILIKF